MAMVTLVGGKSFLVAVRTAMATFAAVPRLRLLLRLLLRLRLQLLLLLDGVARRRDDGRLLPGPSLATRSCVDQHFLVGVVGLRRGRRSDEAFENFVVV